MNQFNNLGSMFPGPENKLARDKMKSILMAQPSWKITGIVMTNPDGSKCIVDGPAVRWLTQKEAFNLMQNADVRIDRLRHLKACFETRLVAEVQEHGGIPELNAHEVTLREAIASYLEVA
jgi:hypothetical protein